MRSGIADGQSRVNVADVDGRVGSGTAAYLAAALKALQSISIAGGGPGRIAGSRVVPDGLIRLVATLPLGPFGFEARPEQVQDAIKPRQTEFPAL